ncbi:MAG: ABC transporter permease [Nanoarchaeota archaeon]
MIGDYFILAFKSVKHRGLRSWLTILGVMIGIAAVVSLISLGDGLRLAVTGQFSDLAPDRLVVQNAETGFGPPGSTVIKKLNDHDVQVIRSVSDVSLVVPRVIRTVKFEYNEIGTFSYLASIPKDKRGEDFIYDSFTIIVEQGRLISGNDRGKVVLGNDFIAYDKFDKKISVGKSVNISGKMFDVVGVLKRASTFTVNSVVLMSESDMRELLSLGDEHDLIAVQVSDKDKTKVVSDNIRNAMRDDRGLEEGKEDFSVQTPEQALSSINTILNMINLVIVGIATISLLIGGIGISNTLYTSVLERKREIGVMKAIGAKNSDIIKIFVIESGLMGFVGGVVGAIVGLLIAITASAAVRALLPGLNLGVKISFPLLIFSALFAFVIGILAGIVPSIQASRMSPVEALRS